MPTLPRTLVVVAPDKFVAVEGVAVRLDVSALIGNRPIYAIQWDGTSGEIEHADGTATRLPLPDDDAFLQPFFDAHGAEVARLAQVAHDAERTVDALTRRAQAKGEELRAAGFAFDFDDERGVHIFGSTKADRSGWDEVRDIADAALKNGEPDRAIHIRTETGDVTVLASEWAAITLAAGAAFQPVWAAQFAVIDAVRQGAVTEPEEVDGHPAWAAATGAAL